MKFACLIIAWTFFYSSIGISQIFSNIDSSKLTDIEISPSGEKLICGIDFSNPSNINLLVMKLNLEDDVVWVKSFGTEFDEGGYSPMLDLDAEGNIYIVGYTADGAYPYHGLIIKLDNDGGIIWSKVADNRSHLRNVKVSENGDIFTVGTSDLLSHGGDDGILCKFDSEGNLIWNQVVGGLENENFTGLQIHGNTVIASGLTKSYGGDLRNLIQMNTTLDGEQTEMYSFSSEVHENINQTFVDDSGTSHCGYISVGSLFGSLIVELNEQNEFMFAKSFHTNEEEWRGGSSIKIQGNIFFTSRVSNSENEFVVLTKLDESGNHIWSKYFSEIGNHSFDYWSGSIRFDELNEELLIPCYSSESLNFDPLILRFSIFDDIQPCTEVVLPIIENVNLLSQIESSSYLEIGFNSISISAHDIEFTDFKEEIELCITDSPCELSGLIESLVPCAYEVTTIEPIIESNELNLNFEWYINGEIVGESLILETSFNPGIHELAFIAETADNECLLEVLETIEIFNLPLLSEMENLILCSNESFQLEPEASNYQNFEWSDGYAELNRIFSEQGVYELMVYNSCDSVSETIEVLFEENPFEELSADLMLCEGDSITLNLESDSIWINGILFSPPYEFTEPGEFIFSTAGTCEFSSNLEISQTEELELSLENQLLICQGESTELEPVVSGYQNFEWSDGHTELNRIVEDSGLYILTVSHACGSLTDSILVNTEQCDDCQTQLFVPNAFTPDLDNLNEVFLPIFSCDAEPFEFSMSIFNRWGEVIFFTKDPKKGWVGNVKNGIHYAQDGVYTWLITYKSVSSGIISAKTLRGSVLLIR